MLYALDQLRHFPMGSNRQSRAIRLDFQAFGFERSTDHDFARALGVLAKTDTAITNFGKVAADLSATRENVDRILKTLDNMLTDNKLDVETAIIDLRHVVDTVARHIDALNQNMEGAARNMNEFSRQIRQNPGLLLGGKAPPDQASGN